MFVPPPAIVNVVVRNAIPIIGVLFFHWSAANLLILYFIDTLLAVGVIPYALGYYGAFVLVIVYVALTIYAEFRPDSFLAAFGETDKR